MKKHRRNGLKLTLKKVKSRAALRVAVKEIMGNSQAEAVMQCANIVAHRSIRFLIPHKCPFLLMFTTVLCSLSVSCSLSVANRTTVGSHKELK